MSINAIYLRVLRTLREFRSARDGNVAIFSGLMIVPLIGFVGAAIDYSRANKVKTAMQTALDSTVLMIAKEATSDSSSQMQANAQKYFTAMFTNQEAQNINVGVTYTNSGFATVVGTASATLPAKFVTVLGFKKFNFAITSTAKAGITRLRAALVLDNTGSM